MPSRPVTPDGIASQPPLDVDIDALLNEVTDARSIGSEPRTPTPESLALLAEDVEQTTRELDFLDTGAEYREDDSAAVASAEVELAEVESSEVEAGELQTAELEAEELDSVASESVADEAFATLSVPIQVPSAAAPAAEDFEDTHDGVVSYSEPAIAPTSARPHRPTPILPVRVPDIPDLDLHVAAALESVAQRIRAGELHLPPVERAGDEASLLALALAALLAPRL